MNDMTHSPSLSIRSTNRVWTHHLVARLAALSLLATSLIAGCGGNESAPPPNTESAADAPADEVAPSGEAEPPDNGPGYEDGPQRTLEGDSCADHGRAITSEGDFERSGTVWSRTESWGCGCPSGPVFTMMVEPGTNPLRVRLCHDFTADQCDMPCSERLEWDLASYVSADGEVELVESPPL